MYLYIYIYFKEGAEAEDDAEITVILYETWLVQRLQSHCFTFGSVNNIYS